MAIAYQKLTINKKNAPYLL